MLINVLGDRLSELGKSLGYMRVVRTRMDNEVLGHQDLSVFILGHHACHSSPNNFSRVFHLQVRQRDFLKSASILGVMSVHFIELLSSGHVNLSSVDHDYHISEFRGSNLSIINYFVFATDKLSDVLSHPA